MTRTHRYTPYTCLLVAHLAAAFLLAATAHAQFDQDFGEAPARPSLEVTPYPRADAVNPGSTLHIALDAELTEGWHVNAHEPLDDMLIPTSVKLDAPEGFTLREAVYPEPVLQTFSFSESPMAVYEHQFTMAIAVDVGGTVAPGGYTLTATVRYQACNDTQCWRPQTVDVEFPVAVAAPGEEIVGQNEDKFEGIEFGKAPPEPVSEEPEEAAAQPTDDTNWRALADNFEITGRAAGYLNAEDFIAFVDRAEAGEGAPEGTGFEGKSMLVVILLTIVGGLALNLTPCVLPLIPINIGIIGAGAQASSRARGFALGGLYGIGMTLAYGAVGLVAVLTTAAFGALNASPWFNLAIAIVFVVLALAMFEVFLIDFSRFQTKLGPKKSNKGSFVLAFSMGAITALLAGACIAPVVLSVLLFSRQLYAQGSVVGLLLPFFLGLGMALPWPFAGAGLSFLPKPGKWMNVVKNAFGVLILGFAVYYGYLAYEGFSERWVDKAAVRESAEAMDEAGWLPSLSAGLEKAQQENKPVLIDMWATWCKSCLTMNKTTFKNTDVLDRLEGYVKVKYQAEDMGRPPVKGVVEYFAVEGLPTYIILRPETD